MEVNRKALVIGGALLCGVTSVTMADSATTTDVSAQISALQAQVAAQQAQIADLKAKSDQNWLNEQRTEEVKGLIHDALADADTRASLAADNAVAGNDGKFFIKTADDSFRLNIGAQIQVRYIANIKGASPASNGHEDGFQIRRIEPSFDGYIGNPKFEYQIVLQSDRNTGTEQDKIAKIQYAFDLGSDQYVKVFGGRIYDTFGREAQMSSKSQQTVERSAVDYVFCSNDDIVEGIGAEWNPLPEYLKLDVTFTDGMNSGTNLNPETTNLPAAKAAAQTGLINDNGDEFTTTNSEYAFTGRADVKIVGDWKQEADVESWSTDPDLQAFVGAAFHYEENNRNDVAGTAAGTGVSYGSFAEWTADALVKCHGFGAMGSFFGAHFNDATPTASGVTSLQYWGATAQAGYTIKDKVEPFIRYEWLFPDGNLHTNQVNIVTVGANYFIKKHVAKFTLDSMWVLDNLNATNTGNQSLSGTGLVNDVATRKNEVVIRAQFQLLF